jgi:hypothetical protein
MLLWRRAARINLVCGWLFCVAANQTETSVTEDDFRLCNEYQKFLSSIIHETQITQQEILVALKKSTNLQHIIFAAVIMGMIEKNVTTEEFSVLFRLSVTFPQKISFERIAEIYLWARAVGVMLGRGACCRAVLRKSVVPQQQPQRQSRQQPQRQQPQQQSRPQQQPQRQQPQQQSQRRQQPQQHATSSLDFSSLLLFEVTIPTPPVIQQVCLDMVRAYLESNKRARGQFAQLVCETISNMKWNIEQTKKLHNNPLIVSSIIRIENAIMCEQAIFWANQLMLDPMCDGDKSTNQQIKQILLQYPAEALTVAGLRILAENGPHAASRATVLHSMASFKSGALTPQLQYLLQCLIKNKCAEAVDLISDVR